MDDIVPDGLPATLTAAQISWLLDLTPGRLSQLIPGGAIIRAERDAYDIRSVRNFVRMQRQGGANGTQAWNDARTSLARERARLARLNRQEREGELLPASEVTQAGAAVTACLRDRLLTLPSKLAARVVAVTPTEAERLMREQITECLEELSRLSVVRKSDSRRRRNDEALP